MISEQLIERYSLGPATHTGTSFVNNTQMRELFHRPCYYISDCAFSGEPLPYNKIAVYYIGMKGNSRIWCSVETTEEMLLDKVASDFVFEMLDKEIDNVQVD